MTSGKDFNLFHQIYRPPAMPGLQNVAAAAAPAPSASSMGSSDSYNGDNARCYLHQLEDMWNLYSVATELNG